MKKIIALVLTFIMLSALVLPITAVAANDESKLPTIYLSGKAGTIYKADGSIASNPSQLDRVGYIVDAAGPVLQELAMALLTDDYSDYIDSLVAATGAIYEEQDLDSDGNVANGTHFNWDCNTVYINPNAGTYHFTYDWRLSPLEIADQLDIYIERILKVTGASGVNIHCRCLGVNMAMTYVAKSHNGDYGHDFRVRNIMLNTGGLGGYITLGALLSGSIEFNPDSVDKFATHFLENGTVLDDPVISMLAASLITLLNHGKILGLGIDFLTQIYNEIAEELIPKLALCCYGGYPSYWSMVSDKYYDKAVATVFNTDELREEYKVFIEKINAWHDLLGDVNEETGRPHYEDLLLKLKDEGVGVAVIAKYGAPSVPMFPDSEVTGDVRGTVTEISFGATGTNIGSAFAEDYLKSAEENGTAKYISPDKTVDASTALFPDSTWFIKNIKHDQFPTYFNNLFVEFCKSDGQMTVWDSEAYPQYLDYVNGSVVPDESEPEDGFGWSKNPFVALIRFLTALIRLITNVLNGEFQLPSLEL